MSQDRSIELYREFISDVEDINKFTKNLEKFPTQFSFTPLNESCYKTIYLRSSKKVIKRQNYFPLIPELNNTCKSCWKFYLNPRNKSVKGLDIQLGNYFEQKITAFLNSKGLVCKKDKTRGEFPDRIIVDKSGEIKAFIEIKYQSAPWIYAYKEPHTKRECYEGSPALDVKKIGQQWSLIEDAKITSPLFYLFWLDFPCIKGLFFVDIKDVYKYYQRKAKIFERKVREGDFIEKKGQFDMKGQTQKIHPSIFMMKPLEDFFRLFGVKNV